MSLAGRLRSALRLSTTETAITLAIVAWGAAEAVAVPGSAPPAVRLAFAVAATSTAALRARWPIAAFACAVTACACDVLTNVMPLETVTPYQLLPLTTYALTAAGWDRRTTLRLTAIAVLLPVTIVLAFASDAPVSASDLMSLAVAQLVAAAAGWVMARRRQRAAQQQQALDAAVRVGEHAIEAGLSSERRRLASRLQSRIAGALAAGERALSGAERQSPQALALTAEQLQRGAAAVMAELQQLLGVLHERDPGVDQPVSLETVVAAARARGWDVVAPELPVLPAGSALAAARIVEEALAGTPAEPAVVTITASRRDHVLRLRLGSNGTLPTALRDAAQAEMLRERARLHGGRLRVRRGRRWQLTANLPAGRGDRPSTLMLPADLALLATTMVLTLVGTHGTTGATWWGLLITGLLLLVLPLALRRRAPLAMVLVVAAGLLVRVPIAGDEATVTAAPTIGALLASGVAAIHIGERVAAAGAAMTVTLAAVATNLLEAGSAAPTTDTAIILFLSAMAYSFGRLIRENQGAAEHALLAREALSSAHDRELVRAAQQERRLVARDLHDVVAHGVSVVGVLAGASQAQVRTDPAQARRSLLQARAAITEARGELDRLTAALAGPPGLSEPDAGALEPRLQALLGRAAGGGQTVTLVLPPAGLPPLPPPLVEAAFRIVQESLTNARKHAPGAAATVTIGADDGLVLVRIENGAASVVAPGGNGAGRGIAGMRTRAAELGGTLATEEIDGGYRVIARLPYPPTS